ncbi:hypothetical protein BU204_35235, partial [Actinophytocola xanthii]
MIPRWFGEEIVPQIRQSGSMPTAPPPEDGFRNLVQSVQDYGIFMLGTGGHVMSWNPGAARMKRYDADEII